MRTEQTDWRHRCRAGGPQPLSCADVLRDIDASLDGRDKRVLDAAQPDGITTAVLAVAPPRAGGRQCRR